MPLQLLNTPSTGKCWHGSDSGAVELAPCHGLSTCVKWVVLQLGVERLMAQTKREPITRCRIIMSRRPAPAYLVLQRPHCWP
jgi:hypothetical protein